MPTDVGTYLLTQGVLGVMCLIFGGVIVKLYNKIERLEREKIELFESRRVDDKETIKNVTEILSDNSQNMRILSEKIEVGKTIERTRR